MSRKRRVYPYESPILILLATNRRPTLSHSLPFILSLSLSLSLFLSLVLCISRRTSCSTTNAACTRAFFEGKKRETKRRRSQEIPRDTRRRSMKVRSSRTELQCFQCRSINCHFICYLGARGERECRDCSPIFNSERVNKIQGGGNCDEIKDLFRDWYKTGVSIKFSVQRVVKQPCRALYTTWTTAFKWLPPTDPSSADLLLVSRLTDFNLFLHFFHHHHQGLQSIYVIISFDGDASECIYQQIPSTSRRLNSRPDNLDNFRQRTEQ